MNGNATYGDHAAADDDDAEEVPSAAPTTKTTRKKTNNNSNTVMKKPVASIMKKPVAAMKRPSAATNDDSLLYKAGFQPARHYKGVTIYTSHRNYWRGTPGIGRRDLRHWQFTEHPLSQWCKLVRYVKSLV